MGFRVNSFAKIWQVEPKSETLTSVRLSISKKNKQTDQYEQEFSGFVSFIGSATAKQAAQLKNGDRIKLGDVDVTTKYDAEKKITYTNYKVFSFETDAGGNTAQTATPSTYPNLPLIGGVPTNTEGIDNGEIDDSLPF